MPRRNPSDFQQKQSEKRQKQPTMPAITPQTKMALLSLILQSQIQAAAAEAVEAHMRQFGTQSTDTASATNGNVRVDVKVESNHISQAYCPFGDYFGCSQIEVNYVNATTNAVIGSMTFGVNLQSTKKTDKNGHQVNAADIATLQYARNCLQDADSYISLFNKTAAAIVAQYATNQLTLPCGFVTPQNKNMYASVFTNDMPAQLCSMLQGALTGVVVSCQTEAAQQAAKLYGLIALVAIPVIAVGVLGYSKYTSGSFFACCKGGNRDRGFTMTEPTGNTLPNYGGSAA